MTDRSDISLEAHARDAAIAWLVRMQSDDVMDDERAELVRWLSLSELNQRAYDDAELLWDELSDSADAIRAATLSAAVVLPFARAKRRPAAWFAPMAYAAACAAVVLAFAPTVWRVYQGPSVTYQTKVGETRSIRLADGSNINLDAASTVTVRLGWRTRKAALLDGEATFDVAKNPRRPFLVEVGDQTVRVVGTEFNIWHYDHVVDITVRRGVVEVRQPALMSQVIARLTKGEELRHIEGARASSVTAIDPDLAFAWTHGRLVCNDQPLSEIVSYLNRRYTTPIVLSETARDLRFSGVLPLDDESLVVQRLARLFSLAVDRRDGQIDLR